MKPALKIANCHVIGPADRVPQALSLLVKHEVDAAILDVKIEGKPSFAVADDLTRREIPWVFATANKFEGLARRYPNTPVLTKPFSQVHLQQVLAELLAQA